MEKQKSRKRLNVLKASAVLAIVVGLLTAVFAVQLLINDISLIASDKPLYLSESYPPTLTSYSEFEGIEPQKVETKNEQEFISSPFITVDGQLFSIYFPDFKVTGNRFLAFSLTNLMYVVFTASIAMLFLVGGIFALKIVNRGLAEKANLKWINILTAIVFVLFVSNFFRARLFYYVPRENYSNNSSIFDLLLQNLIPILIISFIIFGLSVLLKREVKRLVLLKEEVDGTI